jgi:hypothetical protein
MQYRRFSISLLVFACLPLSVSAAWAQANDKAAYADQLFDQGVALMKSDNCPAAIPEFLSSQQLDPSAATLVNLATCYARIGRKATAWKVYRQAATAAGVEGNDDLRARAFKAMSVLSPTLTKLKIVAPNRSTALSLKLNGQALNSYDDMPVPLDSGENIIEAVAPGHEPWRRSVTASERGATIVIEVPELRPASKPAPASEWRTAAVMVGGAGVAGIVVGAILGVSAKQTHDDSNVYCRAGRCTETGVELRDEAFRKATVSTLAVGIGAAAAATGVVLWLTSPRVSERGASISAHGTPSQVGLSLDARL